MPEQFHNRVKRLRLQKRLTQAQLGELMGITRFSISQIESGRYNPRNSTKARLAEALGVSIDVLEGKVVKSDELKDLKIRESVDIVLIPIVGEVRAGFSMYAQNNIIGYQKVDSDQINRNKTYFFLKVVGDSMNLYIREGDTVLVEHTPSVESGDIVIAMVDDDEAVIKRIKFHKDSLSLIPESTNPIHKVQIYNPDKVKIIGKVIKSERYF